MGTVRAVKARGTGLQLEIAAPIATPEDPLVLGESIAVNGACLTVTDVTESGGGSRFGTSAVSNDTSIKAASFSLPGASPNRQVSPLLTFTADVLEETLRCTMFRKLKAGDVVNLERALKVGDRLGGHLVAGHVDEVGFLLSKRPEGNDVVYRIGCSSTFARGVIRKGSVTLSGVSLTVVGVGGDWFEVALIPTTLRETLLGALEVGGALNLEADLIGAYVRRALGRDTFTLEQLIAAGFAD